MRDLSELNINEGGKPVTRPSPTREAIEAFQDHFGFELPEDYLQLLRYSNGGHPELDSFAPVDRPDYGWAVDRFYHLTDDKNSTYSLWKEMKPWRPILGAFALPFATDGGGNQFFLDFRTSPPSVKVCVHDENFAIVNLAPSLETFIDALHVNPDMI